MKKIFLIFVLLLLVNMFNISAIIISEFESNPLETDSGNEWIELYNEGEINLSTYKLVNNDGDEIILNESFSGYYVYIFEKQWLDNSDEKVFLYRNEELIDETDLFDDSKNNDETWQLCDTWEFIMSTKGEKNNCDEEQQDSEDPEPPEEPEQEEEDEEKDEEEKEIIIEEQNQEPDEPFYGEIISLDSKDIKGEDDKKLNIGKCAIYGFIGFCVLLVILIALSQREKILLFLKIRKFKKNEFE